MHTVQNLPGHYLFWPDPDAVRNRRYFLQFRISRVTAPPTSPQKAEPMPKSERLEAATAKVADERVESAYAALFAFSIVVKIVLVPLVWNL